MKNKELFELRETLNEVDYIRGKVFAYAVFKNKQILDQEIMAIKSTKNDPHPDYLNFENERTLLCQIHSEKDQNNHPVLQYNPDGTQAFKIVNIEGFNKEYQEIAEKYKDVLEDMQKSKSDYDRLLEKESDIKLTKISINDLPDDISASFLEKIKYMID
jgi:hypothetical protein